MYTGEDLSKFDTGGGSLNDLQANSTEWSKVFYILGISHAFTRNIHGEEGDIFAVSDQTLRCYSDEEIKTLLCQNIILDLPSTEVLVQRGFGDLIGVNNVSRVKLEDSAYSLEEMEESFFGTMEGDVKPRMCAQRCADPIGVLELVDSAEVLSTIKGAEFDIKFPGSALYTNQLGGTVYTTAYPLGTGQFYMAYFNRVRQEAWTKLLFKMGGRGQSIACGHPFHVHAHNLKDRGISIACTNVIYDTAKNVVIKLPAADIDGKRFQALDLSCSESAFCNQKEAKRQTDCVRAQRVASQGQSVFQASEKLEWVDVQPEIQIEDGIATLSFDLQVPTLKTAFITIR